MKKHEAYAALGRTIARAQRGEAWPCFLCGMPTTNRCIFEPKNPQAYGAPRGKGRVLMYALCPDCVVRNPDRDRLVDRLEARLRMHLTAERN